MTDTQHEAAERVSDDIVARLRADAAYAAQRISTTTRTIGMDCLEAADLIEALRDHDARQAGVVTDAIIAERQRQVIKGFDATHDNQHVGREIIHDPEWGAEVRLHRAYWTKDPTAYRAELVQVAAMIVAEVERSDREGLSQ